MQRGWPGRAQALPASVVKLRGSLEAVLSPSAIWILYLAAGGPQCLGSAFCLHRILLSDFGEAEVCPVGAMLPRVRCHDVGHTRPSLWPQKSFFLVLREGPKILDSRIAKEGKQDTNLVM